MKRIIIFLLLSIVIILPSCKKVPLSVGETITVSRELQGFNKMIINDDVNVTMIKADTNYIEISAGKNLMPNIITETSDGNLVIRNDNAMNWIRTYDYTIDAKLYFKEITDITHSGSGFLKSQNQINDSCNDHIRITILHACGDIDLEINDGSAISIDYTQGTSALKLRGTGNRHIYIGKRSYGIIDISDLGVTKATVKNFSSGDCYVAPSDTLNAYIYNLGNIYYKGNPSEIESYIDPDSRGKLIHIE
ncbi:MAG: GIN domain-containing protein [Candidatus Limimorpha sp.]